MQSMIEYRDIDPKQDRELIQDIHAYTLFESAPPTERSPGYLRYREHWMATDQPGQHLAALEQSLEDERTIAMVVTLSGTAAGLFWVTFHDVGGYGFTYAELEEIGFKPEFQRQGLGRMAMYQIEEMAVQRGASTLRSTGPATSETVRGFHDSSGFQPLLTVFEKPLTPGLSPV